MSADPSDANADLSDTKNSSAAHTALARLMREVCDWCQKVLLVDGALVTVISRTGGNLLLYATDPTAEQPDDLQFDFGEGPSLSAFNDARPALQPDLSSSAAQYRWPAFVRAAVAANVMAAFAYPLLSNGHALGALELYRHDAGGLDPEQLAHLEAAAARVTEALLDHRAALLVTGTGEIAQWLTARTAVQCAAGMVAV